MVALTLAPIVIADPLGAVEDAQKAIFRSVAPSVVFIATPAGVGSGFFVTRDGLVLTNAHVVGSRDSVDVVLHDGTRHKGRVVEKASGNVDLALVQLPLKGTPTIAQGAPTRLEVGAWVAAVGHGKGGLWTFNTGMVSNIFPSGAERPVFQTQIPLNPGNSGGPVVDREGRVVGIVTAGIESAQAINFAIGLDVAMRSLAGLADACECLMVDLPAGTPLFLDGANVGKGPRVALYVEPGTYELSAAIGQRLATHTIAFTTKARVRLE